jgi:hypothetical protein
VLAQVLLSPHPLPPQPLLPVHALPLQYRPRLLRGKRMHQEILKFTIIEILYKEKEALVQPCTDANDRRYEHKEKEAFVRDAPMQNDRRYKGKEALTDTRYHI